MVGSPIARRVSRHRRTASHFALRLIRAISLTREEDLRAARGQRRRDQRRRASAKLLRDLKDFFGVPQLRRQRRPRVLPQQQQPEPPIIISSGESSGEEGPVPRGGRGPLQVGRRAPNLNPPPAPPTIAGAALRQAFVLLERIDGHLPLPQFLARPAAPLVQEPEPATDWEQL